MIEPASDARPPGPLLPASFALIAQLEAAGAGAWPSARRVAIGPWWASLDRGVTRRANSVSPAAPIAPGALPYLLDRVERVYGDWGLPACFKMTRAAQPLTLEALLADRGYRRNGMAWVMTGPRHSFGDDGGDFMIEASEKPDHDWLSVALDDGEAESAIKARATILSRLPRPRLFVLAYLDGMAVGAGSCCMAGAWACHAAIRTLPAARGRGVASAVVGALSRWASRQGVQGQFLQVEIENETAQGVYTRLGFRPRYAYHYRVQPRE